MFLLPKRSKFHTFCVNLTPEFLGQRELSRLEGFHPMGVGMNLNRRLPERCLPSQITFPDGCRFLARGARRDVLMITANSKFTHRSTGIKIGLGCFILWHS